MPLTKWYVEARLMMTPFADEEIRSCLATTSRWTAVSFTISLQMLGLGELKELFPMIGDWLVLIVSIAMIFVGAFVIGSGVRLALLFMCLSDRDSYLRL